MGMLMYAAAGAGVCGCSVDPRVSLRYVDVELLGFPDDLLPSIAEVFAADITVAPRLKFSDYLCLTWPF